MTSSPALSHGRVFFGGMNGTVYAVNEDSGEVIWKRELGLRISTSVTALGDSVYVGTIVGRLYRVAADSGAILAEYPLDARPFGQITTGDDSILVDAGDDIVLCLASDLKTERWRKKASRSWTTARPYVIHGTVFQPKGHIRTPLEPMQVSKCRNHRVLDCIFGVLRFGKN